MIISSFLTPKVNVLFKLSPEKCLSLYCGRERCVLRVATWAQLGLQDVSSPYARELIFFHDYVLVVMILILTVVLYSLYCCFNSPFTNLYLLQGQVVETI